VRLIGESEKPMTKAKQEELYYNSIKDLIERIEELRPLATGVDSPSPLNECLSRLLPVMRKMKAKVGSSGEIYVFKDHKRRKVRYWITGGQGDVLTVKTDTDGKGLWATLPLYEFSPQHGKRMKTGIVDVRIKYYGQLMMDQDRKYIVLTGALIPVTIARK